MNGKFLKVSLLLIVSSAMFITGCGPQDINDAGYVAQTSKMGSNLDVLSKDDQEDKEDEVEAQPAAEQAAAPAKAQADEGGCPTGGCESPPDLDTHRTVQLPDQVQSETVKVTPTGEKQMATDIVDYKTTRHIWQPRERHHTVHKHRNLVNRHHTKIVYHPTDRRINRVVRTGSSSDEVMPTEEVVEPTIDYGCSDAVVAAPVVARPALLVRPVVYGVRYPWSLRRF